MFWFGALIYLILCGVAGYRAGSKETPPNFLSLISALGLLALAWLAYGFGYLVLATVLF